jgi:hypothetical protein
MAIDPSIALGVKPMQLDSPLNTMGQMMNLRNASQENQLRQFQMQQAQQDAQRNEMLRQSLSGIDTSTSEGQDAYGRALLKSGNVEQAQKFATGRATQDKEQRAADSAKIKLASDQTELGIKLLSAAVDQPTYDAARARMQQNGLDISKMPPAFSPEYRDSELRQGVDTKTLLERRMADLGGTVLPVDFAGQAAGTPLYKTATPGEKLTDSRLREQEADAEKGMSHDAMLNAAARYNIDGSMPGLGMGKNANIVKMAILDMAALLNKGVDPSDQRVRQLSNKANAGALGALTKQENLVGAFERNFTKNADLALGLNDKRDHSGVPLAQKWINAGRKALSGDPDLRQFDIAIKSVVNEYGKIISGSMGNTALAQGEIKRMEDKLASAQTPAEVASVISFMKQETANRMAGFKEQKGQLTGEISGRPPATATPATATPAASGGVTTSNW